MWKDDGTGQIRSFFPHLPPQLMRMPGDRPSSSVIFFRFFSASSTDLYKNIVKSQSLVGLYNPLSQQELPHNSCRPVCGSTTGGQITMVILIIIVIMFKEKHQGQTVVTNDCLMLLNIILYTPRHSILCYTGK